MNKPIDVLVSYCKDTNRILFHLKYPDDKELTVFLLPEWDTQYRVDCLNKLFRDIIHGT